MLTPEQEKWLAHLPDDNEIEIFPYDPAAPKKFEKIKNQIQGVLEKETEVLHCGATSLGISGQGELDIYVPVAPEKFDETILELTKIFNKPESLYPLERARFVAHVDGTKAEIFVVNKESENWLRSCRFEECLKKNPEALEAYRNLKEAGNGLSTREYYRRKIEFINDVLGRGYLV